MRDIFELNLLTPTLTPSARPYVDANIKIVPRDRRISAKGERLFAIVLTTLV